MKIIFDYNRTLFNPETDDLYPGVLNLLPVLSKKYELFLISRNDPARSIRLAELGIGKYFQKILFVNQKSKEIFQEIAGNTGQVIVVGDSIGDEITIGNQLGLITVRIRQGKFASDLPSHQDEAAKFTINNIAELTAIINNYEKQ